MACSCCGGALFPSPSVLAKPNTVLATPNTRRSKMKEKKKITWLAAWPLTHSMAVTFAFLYFLAAFAQGQGQGPGSIEWSMPEEVNVGYRVGSLDFITDYTFTFQDVTDLFEIDDRGDVRTLKRIDRESLGDPAVRLFVVGMPSGDSSSSSSNSRDKPISFNLVVNVLDINDNAPSFGLGGKNERISYQEDARKNQAKSIVTATDPDAGENGTVADYEIVSGNSDGMFGLDFSGLPLILYIVKKGSEHFDREKIDSYQLKISARDSGIIPKVGFIIVDVSIIDVNDNIPAFDLSEYTTQVNESAPIGTSIFRAEARDDDIGLNGEVMYRLEDPTRQFSIEEVTGVIRTLTSPLVCSRRCGRSTAGCNSNSCFITVESSDKGLNSLTGRAYVYVEILDENDHNPEIVFVQENDKPPVTIVTVDENVVLNTPVASISVTDEDSGPNGETTVRIVKGNEEGYFRHFAFNNPEVSVDINEIHVQKPLDRETIKKFNLTVLATDKGVPPRTSTAHLIILVNDANDHYPQFLSSSYEVTMSELSKPNSFVANVKARDEDEGVNSLLTYDIYSGNELGWLHIDHETGLVTTKGHLDHEQLSQVVLNISTHDGGSDPKYNHTILTIDILDENDVAPIFEKEMYVKELDENQSPGTSIIQVKAEDYDVSVNGSVKFSIHPDTQLKYPGAFSIDPKSGQVIAEQRFDREDKSNYVIKIIAEDGGSPALSSTASIEVIIRDKNDNSPVFAPEVSYVNVFDSDPVGVEVTRVTASDKDIGDFGKVSYSLKNLFNSFEIHRSSGVISTKRQLQRQQEYILTVTAVDGGGRTSENDATVKVIVTSTSSSAPVFTQDSYRFTVTEDSSDEQPEIGREVGRVEAKKSPSSQSGAKVVYAITGGDSGRIFEMNTVDVVGVITTRLVVDREEKEEYSLTVIAVSGEKISSRKVTIIVKDVNDNSPSFVTETTEAEVLENWPVGHNVFLAQAVDEDFGVNAKIVYTLSSKGNSNNVFTIGTDSGVISLAKSPRLLSEDKIWLEVTATDTGTPQRSMSMTVTIRITDENDHTPMFSNSQYELFLSEYQPVNQMVMELVAVDNDVGRNGDLTYDISRGNEEQKFGIFPDGSLYLAHNLDRETKDMYSLTVMVKDNAINQRSSAVNVSVYIQDENDNAPRFEEVSYEFKVKENSNAKTFVGAVKSMDADIGRNAEIVYSLQKGNNNFTIDPITGAIYTAKVFDREYVYQTSGISYYLFKVVASDNGFNKLQSKVDVKVIIEDENDSPPIFVSNVDTFAIVENAAIDDVIITMNAVDADEGNNAAVTYSIVGGNEDDRFKIGVSSGSISLKQKLDREDVDQYRLTIRATDTGSVQKLQETDIQIQIIVVDYNDNAPEFVNFIPSISVKEDTLPGDTLVVFSGTDKDMGNNGRLRFDIVSGNEDDHFTLNMQSGKLYLSRELDYEVEKVHRLNITLSDSGFPALSVAKIFTVRVLDMNDNSPRFTDGLSKIQVSEDKPVDLNIAKLSADDLDSGEFGAVRFSVYKQSPGGEENVFSIHPTNGQVSLKRELDRETVDKYEVTILAVDQDSDESQRKTAEKSLTILVGDVNDNDPVFQSPPVFLIPYPSSRGSTVATLAATDADSGDNSKMQFSFSGSKPPLFNINPSTGTISLAQTLPSTPLSYDIRVSVSDDSDDPINSRTATATIRLMLYTSGGAGPQFSQIPDSPSVTENSRIGTSILQVSASPSTPALSISYHVTKVMGQGESYGSLFEIDNNGILSSAAELDREKLPATFTLDISAIETQGTNQRATTTQITVQLQDENDNAPIFTSSLFDAAVPENGGPGASVARVFVSDPDATGNLMLTLKGQDATHFSIDQNGVIASRKSLDFESADLYQFEVDARDGTFQASCRVQIKVLDTNDHRPEFSRTFYSFDLPEDAPKGHTVGKVEAHDLDSGMNGHVIYELVSDWGRQFFQINNFLGELTLIKEVDFEERQLFTLTVIARDEGSSPKSSEVIVYMNVKDVNDNQPEFDPMTYSREISEDAPRGTLVVNVSATDIDSGLNGEIRYSIFGEEAELFGVGPINGSVYTTALLDRELHPVYSLVVIATDQASEATERLSTRTTVEVKLKDVNDRKPEFTSPSSVGIREDSKTDSTVFTVRAYDLDEGVNGEITFILLSQTGPGNIFSLNSQSGALVLELPIDRETTPSYTLVVEARDGGSKPHSSQQTLDVEVLDANDNAPDFTRRTYEKTIAEDVSVGTSLLRVLAQDDDEGFNGAVRYFIVGGAGRHDFHLDMSSGVLRVQKSLDFERTESYTLTVQAEDSSVENPLHTNATVIITVTDVNDFVPVFDNSPYHTFVQEGLQLNKELPIFNITARDEDSEDNGLVQYALRNIINYSSLFRIDPLSGQVLMLKPLDRETTPEYILTIIAIDNGIPTQTGSTTLTVFVKDVNDHAPIFESSDTYMGHVTENRPEGTKVIQVSATDRDEGMNSRIVYTLEDNEDGHFRVQPYSGLIETTGPLDREMETEYLLTVVATDQGIPPRSASVKVKVVVNDDNDHVPDFGTKKYSVTIHDSSTADFVIGVTAIDRDVGNNGKVVYSLEGPDSSSFHINSETGVITHATSLNRTPRTFTFVVRASDLGNQPLNSTATVTVQLSATSPANRPVFDDPPSNLKIKENAPQGTLLTTLRATTTPAGGRISYHIAGGNVNNAFKINSSNGSVLVASKIDYEVTDRFQLWIEARDQMSGSVSTFKELTVDVEDMNDNDPTFSQAVYSTEFMENSQLNSRVFKVTATDLDKNKQLVYRIKQGNTNNTFGIDASTGLIRTANPVVDRERIPFYSLVVEASDLGTPKRSASTTVRISLLDDNDNQPTFTGSRSVAVPEDLPLNSLVMQLTIRDKDVGQNAKATFKLEDENGDELPFALDPLSGNITNIRKLDAESMQRYRPQVSVTDNTFLSQTTLTIRLLDVNDNAPKFQSTVLSFYFRELQAPGAKVGQLTALDLDISSPNKQFFFSLKRPSSLFELDAETGVVIALETFHFFGGKTGMESMNEHVLEAVVTDLGVPSLSSEATVIVHITDSNDHSPIFKQDKYFSAVPINLSSEETILQVVAKDDEDYGINAEISYSIVGGTGFAFFSIHPTQGKISPKKTLAGRENQKLYITVRAMDKGIPAKMATVTVELEITPVNTQSPRFNSDPFSATVREDAKPGHLIAQVTATDADNGLNGEVRYAITGGNDNDLFEINSEDGELKVKGGLDFETQKIHTITIRARDRGLFYKHVSKDFTIVLKDVNDNPPQFEHAYYDAYIKENSRPFTSIFKVSAIDLDTDPSNKEILYSIKGTSDTEDYFRIDDTSGEITSTTHIFDYEKRNLYTLLIMAYNTDGQNSPVKKSLTTVYVHITGANEYIPKFVKNYYSFQISESAEMGSSVGTVSAVDQDKGPEGIVYYYLEGQSNLLGFMVESVTGIVRVAERADYESSHYVTLQVLAKNWGSVQGNDTDLCTVNITISDANDPPEFSKERYIANIDENSEGFRTVIQVQAEDKDIQPSNRVFTYEILRGNEQGKFRITQDGTIETTGLGRLDREITPIFELVVGAQDSGSPPKLGSATVEVHLNDVNDNGPQFDPFDLTVHVSENETSGVLVTILSEHTTDLDLPGNQGPYKYMLLDSAASKYFRILPDSGRVETKQRLNREESPKFLVPVVVSDSGRPRVMSSTLTFTIIVQDINNSPPKPRPLNLLINVLDKGQIKGKVADVRPLDSDLTGKYTCSILQGNSANFFINSGCDLEVAGDLLPRSYSLTIRASDGKFEPVEYAVTIQVVPISNQSLENSIALKFQDISASRFLESGKYTVFRRSVEEQFGSSFSCLVFSLKEKDGDLFAMFYLEESNKQILPRADLIRGFRGSVSDIENVISLDIEYLCSSNPCSNDGACYTTISLASGNLISSSSAFILTSSNVALVPLCICKNPFTGPLCKDRQERCGADYCHNSGTCVDGECECKPEWKGDFCQEDVNECAKEIPICKNEGVCKNLDGSFECSCPEGYHGRLCQLQNYCANQPCTEHGTCIERIKECQCDYGYHGQQCQFSSMSFGESSYAEFLPVDNYATFNASLFVATVQSNALLMFSPIMIGQTSHGFVAMEILAGHVTVSFRLSTDQDIGVVSLSTSDVINSGKWHRLEFMKNTQTATLMVQECDQTCKECDVGRGCSSEVQVHLPDQQVVGRQLSLGGVRQFKDVEDQRGEVSTFNFVGCMHSVAINSRTYSLHSGENTVLNKRHVGDKCPRSKPGRLCDGVTCYNGGTCVDGLDKAVCHCLGEFSGPFCKTERQPFSLGANGIIKFSLKESYVRQSKLDSLRESAGRKRRAVAQSSVMMRFRTTKQSGVLYSSRTSSASCLLWFSKDGIHFLLKNKDAVNDPLTLADVVIADGKWHNVTVTSDGSQYSLDLDGGKKSSGSQDFGVTYDFDSLDIVEMSISGRKRLPDNTLMAGLDGCLSKFLINGNSLPLNGSSGKYSIEVTEGVAGECSGLCEGNPCGGDNKCVPNGEVVLCHYMAKEAEGLETGIIVVIVFLIILLIVIVVIFVLFKTRREIFYKCVKSKKESRGGNHMVTANSSNGKGLSNSDSLGTNGGIPHYATSPSEEEIIRNHIVGELAGQKTSSLTARPDLIGSSYSPQMLSDGVLIMDPDDLQVAIDDEGVPEHYDFENASSIAPSDIAPSDMIRHYRDFRNGKQPHYHHDHHNHHKHHHHNQLQQQLPPGSQHLYNKYRDSPTSHNHNNYRGSPHNHNHPHFPRQSPISLTGSALSVPTHSSPHMAPNANGGRPSSALAAVNQTQRARLSPLTQLHVRSPRSHPHSGSNAYSGGSGNNSSTNYNSNNNLQDVVRGSRSNSIGSHHSHSSSSSATTVPSGGFTPHHPHPSSNNIHHKSGKSRTPKGLTVEDVNRLNARPDMILHDPTMSSVDVGGRGKADKPHHHNHHHPHHHHPHPHHHIPQHPVLEGSLLLEPPDSSSDDSGANDSFTCSEFEYDNDPATRTRLDFDPSKMIFSKLTEVDNECDENNPNNVPSQMIHVSHQSPSIPTMAAGDGLNSNGDSFASTNASASSSNSNSPSSPVSQQQPISSQYDFDALLNWGPNFDKLVGVFSDIAQLPDSGNAVDGDLDHTYEEYV